LGSHHKCRHTARRQGGNIILAGDIGGTKTALALYEYSDETLCQIHEATFQSAQYPALETALEAVAKIE